VIYGKYETSQHVMFYFFYSLCLLSGFTIVVAREIHFPFLKIGIFHF